MFRCYRQLDNSECGLTCIRMIARHYGVSIPVKHLKKITDLNRLGMSIKDIRKCCGDIGLFARAVKLDSFYAAKMPLPAILYWKQCHFVVLYKISGKGNRFHIADPAQGKMVYSKEDFCKYWLPEGDDKGLAILVEPTEEFYSKEYPETGVISQFLSYIFGFFKNYRRSFAAAILMTLLIMAADLAIPLLLRRTVDEGIELKSMNIVVSLLLCQLAITVGSIVSSSVLDLLLTRTGLNINIDMIKRFLDRLSKFPISFFDRRVSSDFVQKINDQSRIKDFLMSFPNSMLTTLLTVTVFSYLLFHYSVPIFIVFILMSFLEILWNISFLDRKKSIDYAIFTHSSANHNHAYELTNGMADLKVNNAEKVKINKWRTTQSDLNKTYLQLSRLGLIQGGGHSLISRIKEISITGISAFAVIEGDMTMGMMLTLGYITGRLSQPFNTFSSMITRMQNAILSYQRIEDVIVDESEFRGNKTFKNSSIRFENVSFKYAGSSSPFVIRDFSLEVEEGKVTALVGESGCGKTTLIKLMLGFYIPQKGNIYLSDYPINDIDNYNWLLHCGVVMQECRIFTGSILENITFSEETPDLDKAVDAIKAVGLYDFIQTLPMKLYTMIGVSGVELSGGQKQRLMIARALYKRPEILFLDEATSSLDANNERSIVDHINDYRKGKTTVIAAHRLSTVRNADKIVFIKDGMIAEIGTHEELVALKGHYFGLVKNQLELSA